LVSSALVRRSTYDTGRAGMRTCIESVSSIGKEDEAEFTTAYPALVTPGSIEALDAAGSKMREIDSIMLYIGYHDERGHREYM